MAFKSDPGQCSCGNICNRLEKSGACPCLIQIQQDILGTDSAASSRVGQILLFRVEGSIPYRAYLKHNSVFLNINLFCSYANILSVVPAVSTTQLHI